MKEKISNKVLIQDAKYDTFRIFLEYLYTSQLPNLDLEVLSELLHLAEQYMLEHMKSLCEKQMKKYATAKTVSELYELAKRYNAQTLERHCIKVGVRFYEILAGDKGGVSKTLLRAVKQRLNR